MKKSVISIISMMLGATAGAGIVEKIKRDKVEKEKEMSGRHLALFLIMNQWVKVKQEGKNLSSYFINNEYQRIAIYGMSYVGETLVDELKGTGVEVIYGIDRRAEFLYTDIEIVTMDDTLKEVDAIVVTAVTFFDAIKEQLSKRMGCPVISLESILYEV